MTTEERRLFDYYKTLALLQEDLEKEEAEKKESALQLIAQYGSTDGGHHKQWVLDQVARLLAGEGYEVWKPEGWEEGVAP